MANVLIHAADEAVTVPAHAARKLLEKGDGDAALLYLALLRHHGTVAPRSLAGELRWDRLRIEAAEAVLRELGLVAAAAEAVPEPADEHPAYSREDVAAQLEKSGEFRTLTAEVERKLGKRLTTPDIGMLLGLNDYLGLPADVIYLLVCHCAERVERRYGPGRRPGMKQIEREGYAWARRGLMTQESAAAYIKDYQRRRKVLPELMALLGLGDRRPGPTEERYLLSWAAMGFDRPVIELAYDKTLLKCKELKWPYMNKILTSWHQKGLHTLAEVEAGDRLQSRSAASRAQKPAQDSGAAREDLERMERYLRRMREEPGKEE